MDCCLRLAGNQNNVSEWSDMYEWTVVYVGGNQDNVSEWSDMYGWTVVYGWPGIKIMYQSGVTCMSGLLFTVGW